MSKINDGGPAYPVQSIYVEDQDTNSRGMTLRDYFAGQALAGWLASYSPEMSHPVGRNKAADIADLSYEMADEMLNAREAKK